MSTAEKKTSSKKLGKKIDEIKEVIETKKTNKKLPPIQERVPWEKASLASYIPMHLEYPEWSMFDQIESIAQKYPNHVAFDFMGRPTTYKKLVEETTKCAKALRTIGVRENDCVTIAMPNCPQAVYMFYGVNMIGAIANMIHPLSAEKEIEHYLNVSGSVTAITLDQFYHKFEKIRENTKIVNIIIASIKDELSTPIRAGYMMTEGRKIKPIPKDAPVIRWNQFMALSNACFYNFRVKREARNPAVMLYSGGTTGTTKGIVLTNGNFNALACQIVATNPMFRPGDKMLAAMPIFHGFGLGVCIHSMLANGGRCILIPRFTPKSYSKQILKYKCNFIAGVPTLFEALLRIPAMEGKDLSFLKGVFSGGDSLSIELKKKFDKFLYDHHASIQVREGYGTTETVTACCLTPPSMYKEGSIGIPFPDTYIKIVEPDTDKEVPYGTEGEILLSGPTAMKRYWDNPEETAQTLRKHDDGLTWVYTGDLGIMDEEGFVYFKGRSKRMIISSGYNIYPSQLENILDAHEKVQMSCVIGVPDSYKMQKVKAFVTLKPGITGNDEVKEEIMAYCRQHLAKYEMPYDIEFKDDMPKTLVGKVAYRKLEEEELAKIKAQEENS
ncbi:MAG: AMP-binding protein [Erysipelotrichaceae bacterium]|nr:AMP-binding protein [Erysipelotrichaceae bacterium]